MILSGLGKSIYRGFRWLSIVFALGTLLAAATALAVDDGARRIALVHRFSVTNPSDAAIERYYHRVSIPPTEPPRQRLLEIEYPYPESWRKKPHKNGVDDYVEVKLEIPPHTTLARSIRFILELRPYDLRPEAPGADAVSASARRYLAPSPLVESDDPRIAAIAAALPGSDALQRLEYAHRYPGQVLQYRDMRDSQGALFALEHGYGDCTEYAALFVALARDLGFPARLTAEFNVPGDEPRTYGWPNHHAAEVLVGGRWIPADPNLAAAPDSLYGFGFGAAHKIVLKREGAWTWGNWYPGSPARPEVEVEWLVQPLVSR